MNFVTTFDPSFPDIAKAIRKFSYVLSDEEECKKVFPEESFRVVYSHKILKNFLHHLELMILANRLKLRGFNRKGGV